MGVECFGKERNESASHEMFKECYSSECHGYGWKSEYKRKDVERGLLRSNEWTSVLG